MTSHPRRGSGPVRQHSLQQLPRRHHQVKRQRSAEENRSFQARSTDPTRARRDNERSNASERPKVRIAWGDDVRVAADQDPDSTVEVVACQIGTGKSRPMPNPRQPRMMARNFGADKNCGTLLYSRQELAERLRLAWKQREANKSNIDVFLAQGTTEERSDSRLSGSSSPERSPARSANEAPTSEGKTINKTTNESKERGLFQTTKKITNTNGSTINSIVSISSSSRAEEIISSATLRPTEGAKSRRASFRSCTNMAFCQPINEPTDALPTTPYVSPSAKKDPQQGIATPLIEQKSRRTNSAPPQRRANSVGTTNKTQVSIVIEAPRMCKTDQETLPNCTEITCYPNKSAGPIGRSVKPASSKRRAKSAKRKANSATGKDLDVGRARIGNSEAKCGEVVTMVSLVSDADSDSEIEVNSPRDDKLISQLRSNLPTAPIIKNNVSTCCSLNSMARRPMKSVSFQQDSIEGEEPVTGASKIRPRSVQVGRVTGSALPTPEEARSWRPEATTSATTAVNARQRYESSELTEISLTDREKRCLIVPIGDPRSDKKRKLLRTRSTPPKSNEVEKEPGIQQTDTEEVSTRAITESIKKFIPLQQSTSVLLQASVSKLAKDVAVTRTESESEVDSESVEPAFQTTKEKECWHLYRRMCDRGVCVSFDTVLRNANTDGIQTTQEGNYIVQIRNGKRLGRKDSTDYKALLGVNEYPTVVILLKDVLEM